MKKIYFSLSLLMSAIGYSQTTAIPDTIFEQALIDQGIDTDGTINGQVLNSDIEGVTILDVRELNISDLTGIEGFTSLENLNARVSLFTSLDVSQNTALRILNIDSVPLTSLDVTQNPALFSLNVFNNELTSLDLSQNPELAFLFASDNLLTSIDVSQNPELSFLGLNNNQITSIDVSQNTELVTLTVSGTQIEFLDLSSNVNITELGVSNNEALTGLNIQNGNNELFTEILATGNPSLECIQVDDLSIEAAPALFPEMFMFDQDVVFSLDCGFPGITEETTAIPDSIFEQALIDLGIDSDGIINGQVPTSDISAITNLTLNEFGISDLTGIEGFTSLIELLIVDDQLTSLDVSANTALTTLALENSQITSLDLSQNAELTELNLSNNQLTSLDVTQNTALEVLGVSGNQLTSFDVSANTALTFLDVSENQLVSVDVTQNSELEFLNVSDNQLTSFNLQNGNNEAIFIFSAIINPDLACIQVDDAEDSERFAGFIDEGASFSTDCAAFLSTDDFELRDVTLFPNPTSNVLNITIPSSAVLERINIYNSVGQSVGSTQQTVIGVSDLSDGIYFLEIITDKGLTTSRFIKN